jgi:nucleoside-diphosphate-sugar epimerase
MARVLIVGCGCRGRALAADLVAAGHAVRGTTRDPAGAGAIAEAGGEPWVGDPDRLGTLLGALDGVTFVCWLLGSARGAPEAVAALHGARLGRLLEEIVDTPVRGVVYEARGTVDPEVLADGARRARAARDTWRIPVAVLDADPVDFATWLRAARAAVEKLLVVE